MSVLTDNDIKNTYIKHVAFTKFSDDYLEHFGILGMKWGKKNGPPYPLSKSISTGRRLKKNKRRLKKENKRRIKNISKKNNNVKKERLIDVKRRSIMSDDELKKKIQRLKMENELKQLTKTRYKNKVSGILRNIGKFSNDVGKEITKDIIKTEIMDAYKLKKKKRNK